MKKIYFLLIALCFFTMVKAQIVTIPDVKFKAKLLTANEYSGVASNLEGASIKIDANENGEIEESEALQVVYLDVSYSEIIDLTGISSFKNLKTLYCVDNDIVVLNINQLTQLNRLECSSNTLTNIDLSGLLNLERLGCSSNSLTSLNVLSLTNLTSLDCGNNKIASLDLTGLNSLTHLSFYYNPIAEINISSLINLEYLHCDNTKLTNLDFTGLKKITYLSCGKNNLKNLDLTAFSDLNSLYCDENQLSILNLSSNLILERLSCENNQLKTLDLSANTKIDKIDCKNNQLESLKLSPNSVLYHLSCSNNQLTSLDLTGLKNLSELDCSFNQISNLSFIDLPQLRNINCSGNKITDLDFSTIYNGINVSCGGNPFLTTINIKNNSNSDHIVNYDDVNLKYICADVNEIKSIQNQIYFGNININSYCSFTPGGDFYTIQGNQKFDMNSDGCDPLDVVIPNLKFRIMDGINTGSLVSDASGNYLIPVQAGTHTITPILENPYYYTVSPSSVNVTFPTQASPFVQDFCITPNGVHPDLEIVIIPISSARPGFDAFYKIIYKNKGTQIDAGTVNLNFDDTVFDFVSSNPPVTNQVEYNLSWDYSDLKPFESRQILLTMNLNAPNDTPAVIGGEVLYYTATITSPESDETQNDNISTLYQTVVNSLDPNDKTCLEGTTVSPSLIGQYVHYMIRFENSGTANAQNVVVKDIIDLSKFDISTLVPTSASHSYSTKISDGNKVEFIFENIMLPFDDANNDGYIAFKIKTLPTLVVGDTFENEANIYFDYNFPVLTNKATSTFKKTLGTQDFEFSNYFTLYPNPAKSVLNISSKETIEMQSISIYNTLGQLILVVPNAEKVSKIDVSNLKTGNYFIKINSDKGTSNTRFVKE